MYDLIIKKRDGGALSADEINFFVRGVTDGTIPDEQTSAFLMAVYFKGMTSEETAALTLAMAESGETVDLSEIKLVKADKHSTGGVGDKTTLIVAPIVAACGVAVAKMSGRGLGHTGGTLDKLESIPGFRVGLSRSEFINVVKKTGLCITGQSGNLAPADKKLYALRDVTGTVDSVPLIAASVMSKKLAAGADCILLDVKTGSGAFMKTVGDSVRLAEEMVSIGTKAGRETAALVTDMDVPLGFAIGNSLEIIESIETLRGSGPNDLRELCVTLAAHMLRQAGKGSLGECKSIAEAAIESGAALNKFIEVIKAQDGDVFFTEDFSKLPRARYAYALRSPRGGYISKMNSERWGAASVVLGAGRNKKEDAVDHGAGILLKKKPGDFVEENEIIAELFTNDDKRFAEAEAAALGALTITESRSEASPLVHAYVDKNGVEYF